MKKGPLFNIINVLISNQLNSFTKKLPDLILPDGNINKENLVNSLNEHLNEFSKKVGVQTNYLVVKLSKEANETYTITPADNKDFINKVKFIEEVFPKIRNTELFFDKGHRIITLCHNRLKLAKLLKKHYKKKLIAYRIKNQIDPILEITKELLLFAKVNTTSTVESEFCREASKKSKLMRKIKWDGYEPMENIDVDSFGEKSYGFKGDITKLLLLVKWMVFPDTVVFFYPTPNTAELGQGGIVWGIDLDDNTNSDLLWSIEFYAALLCSFIDKILQFQHQQKAKREALKAIIAEIMNRNYAHHIGSHISLRSTFDKILLRIGKKIDTSNPGNSLEPAETATIAQMIKKLDQYKDERNEFIAGLNNEPIFQTFSFYQDVILPLLENTLFMDNIAKNEGICYKNINGNNNGDLINGGKSECRLKIKVYFQKQNESKEEDVNADYYKNNEKIFHSLDIPYFNIVNKIDDTFYDNKEIKNDFKVNLPGSLGKHCIYSILENFIRNTAKHSYDKKNHNDKTIEIILRIKENKENYYVELTDNVSDGSKAVELQKKIEKSILERKNLGISDMKINACLLAGKPYANNNMKEILSVDEIEGENGKKHIAYKFELLKPKEVAIIGGSNSLKNEQEGIYYFADLNAYLECEVKNFRFAIIDSEVGLEVLKENYNHLPFRVLLIKSKLNNQPPLRKNFHLVEKTDFDVCIDSNKFMLKCWDLWLQGFEGSNIELINYFEQKKNEKPTEEWIDFLSANHSKYCLIIKPQVRYKDNNEEIVPKEILNEINSFYIMYDRHGGTLNKLGMNLIKGNFYEHIDKNNRDFDNIFNTKPKPSFINELVEAGLTKILVVDERAAEASTELISGVNKVFNTKGFGQFGTGHEQNGVRKFDACWAAGIYLATHINTKSGGSEYEPLNREISGNDLHCLKIGFKNKGNKISITAETNFMESDEGNEFDKAEKKWKRNGNPITELLTQSNNDFKIDILVIHRTILKKISEQMEVTNFIDKLDVSRILIITGGGVIDFIPEQKKPKIISTDILKNYIIGERPAKLSLVNSLCS